MKRIFDHAPAAVVALLVAAIPVFLWPTGADAYRLPKALLLRVGAIVLVAAGAIALLWGRRIAFSRLREPFFGLTGAIVLWWGIAALAASNRMLAASSWLWLVCGAIVAVATYVVAPRYGLIALVPLVFGGVVNGLSCVLSLFLRESVLWPQFQNRAYGLMGSAHDAGTYLVIPAIVAAAAAAADRRHRFAWLAAAAIPVAGIVATRTAGAAAAVIAGVLVLLWVNNRRAAIAAAVLFCAVAIAACTLPSTRARVAAVAHGDIVSIDDMLSGRVVAFLAAGRMFAHHPLLGVGPGCYAWEYFDEKVAIEGQHPITTALPSRMMQFGEAHSDHLQILAETGLPGYAIFIAAIVLMFRTSFRATAASTMHAAASRSLAAPLGAAIAVMALAEFPFELAAPAVAAVYACALSLAWSHADALA